MKTITKALVFLCLGCAANSEGFKDLDFEGKSNIGDEQRIWDKSWGEETCCEIQTKDGNSFLKIVGSDEGSVGFIEQELIIPSQDVLRILHVSAMIKTEDVQGKGAGINIGIYDSNNDLITTKDMGGFYSLDWTTGDTDWKTIKLSIVSPTNAYKIKIGAILYGKGAAYFDNYEVQFDHITHQRSGNYSPYISKAIEIVKNNSLVRDSINFEDLQTKVSLISKASDQNLALEYLLEFLRKYGDHHSFLMKAAEAKEWHENEDLGGAMDSPQVEGHDNIGIITVPPFHSGNEQLMVAYADSLQQGIKRVYSDKLRGWIVDLRQNTGGNMEPMIVGLGPLLDSGKIGSLVDINGKHEHWYYRDGQYYWENQKGISLIEPFTLNKKLPIVVLTSQQTGSSGEVVAISFIGNTNTISMGKPTWGLTTGNGEFELEDGAKLFMASTKMVDRNGVVYSSQIQPDFIIEEDMEMMASAVKWINDNQ